MAPWVFFITRMRTGRDSRPITAHTGGRSLASVPRPRRLLARRDLIPSEPDHRRAGAWYYALQLGPLEHKLPPIIAHRWRRVTFIVTSGDRFMEIVEINELFEQESPVGQLYVRLKELGILVEREWWIDEAGAVYVVDLALPFENGWLPVTFGDRPGAGGGPALRGRG